MGGAVLLGGIYTSRRVEIIKVGVDASPRSVTPQRTRSESPRLPPLMGQRLREAITRGLPPRNPDTFSSPTYALREIYGFTVAPSEAMLFTLNMFFTLIMRIGGKCYALFHLCAFTKYFFTLKWYCAAEAGFLTSEAHSSLIT